VERDRRNRYFLLEVVWRTAIVWECALRKRGEHEVALQLEQWLRGSDIRFETSVPAED